MSIVNSPNLIAVESAGNTPPGSPVTNGLYIILDTPTGTWSSNANQLALWTGSVYQYFAPSRYLLLWTKDTQEVYIHNPLTPEWVNASSGVLQLHHLLTLLL